MNIQITGNAPALEAQAYVDYLEKKHNRKLKSLDVQIDGDFADLNYEFEHYRILSWYNGTVEQR